MEEGTRYDTFSHLPKISAACLRVIVFDDSKSGIDTLQPYVRFRVQEAADTLDECAKLLAALEKYVEFVQAATGKAFADLAEEFAESRE